MVLAGGPAGPSLDSLLLLVEIKITVRASYGFVLGPFEGFFELLFEQFGLGFFFFGALLKQGLAPSPFLFKQLRRMAYVRDRGFPGRLPVPDHFAQQNVDFQARSAAGTVHFQRILPASVGSHNKMLRRSANEVKRGRG